MLTRILFLFVLVLCLATAGSAQTACTINFDQFSGPSQSPFTGTQIKQGLATISGGALATAATCSPNDWSTIYLTQMTDPSTNLACDVGAIATIGRTCTNCSKTLTITFSQPVSNFSFTLYNGITEDAFWYQVLVNGTAIDIILDDSQSNPAFGYYPFQTYPFPEYYVYQNVPEPTSNIQQVAITPICGQWNGQPDCAGWPDSPYPTGDWDFFIDAIHYTRPDNLSCNFDPTESAPDLGPCDGKHCEGQAGSPINLGTGNVWITQKDFSLPGLGGGISIERTWNSRWQDSNPVTLAGMFGHSWRSTYEEHLSFPDMNTVEYWRADGSAWAFSYNSGTQSYSLGSPPDERASLQFSTVTNQFTLTLADGSQRLFTQPGYLAALIDRNGNQTTVAYDGSNRLTQVTDAAGRSISFSYNDANNPAQATSVQDSVGIVATYTYDSSARLTRVAYADGSSLNFAYDTSDLLPIFGPNHNMSCTVWASSGFGRARGVGEDAPRAAACACLRRQAANSAGV